MRKKITIPPKMTEMVQKTYPVSPNQFTFIKLWAYRVTITHTVINYEKYILNFYREHTG
jgi:hypothetical protein